MSLIDKNPDINLSPSLAEVLAALQWLAQLLQFRLSARLAGQPGATSPALNGLDEMLDELSRSTGAGLPIDSAPPPIPDGGWLPGFGARFGLNPLECLMVAAAIAPSFDGRFAAAFGESQGSNRPERATADLVGRLLALSLPERAQLSSSLQPGSRIDQYGILNLDWSDNAALPLNLQPLELSERIRWHLIDGSDQAPPQLRRYLQERSPRWGLAEAPLPKEALARLVYCVQHVLRAMNRNEVVPLVLLEGPAGAGQLEAAEVIAREQGLSLLEIDLSQFISGNEPHGLATSLMREATLRDAALFLRLHVDDLVTPSFQRRARQLLGEELRDLHLPICATGNLASLALMNDLDRPIVRLELRLPDREVQRQKMQLALDAEGVTAQAGSVDELLNRYNLDHQNVEEVVRAARVLARSSREESRELSGHELETGVELIMSRNLSSLSQRLNARFGWDDLVLPPDVISQLRTLRNLIEFRHMVFEDWGLGRKATSGRGIKALFSGASGTGKTMAAEVIATDLRLPLYRVDLSAVVSKWVGETEKNLEKIFRDAQSSQAILLFDEADALFGKRGQVENANDRHANVEVSFLLQRFETHDGVVILTSNFPTMIDTAFARRMHFMVDFPEPDAPTRLILWKKQLISSLPVAEDIDLGWLAEKFELSGANIRNIVLGAAFIAAGDTGKVGMGQLVRALSWECQKLGRLPGAGEFGKYYHLLDVGEAHLN